MSRPKELSFEAARRNLKESLNARWPHIAADFDGEVWPAIIPSFTLSPRDTIFTIGSCFARNVEEHLARLGCNVPMLRMRLPPEEWRGAPNSAMNKFHPPAFEQALGWTARVYDRDGIVTWEDCEPLALDCGKNQFFDLDMGATPPVSRERFVERRQHIYDIFAEVFKADCLTMTPGLIEAWRDTKTGLYTHEGPQAKAVLARSERFSFRQLDYETCKAAMLSAISIVRTRNPSIKIILTTSPVPIIATFSGQDIRIANMQSKSTLRTICGELAATLENVDYFPSYEAVTMSNRQGVWEEDRIHVTFGFVGKIVQHLLRNYFPTSNQADVFMQAAITAISSGKTADAKSMLEQAVQHRPDFPEAQALLADVMTTTGDPISARVSLESLVAAHPDNMDFRLYLVRALLHLSPPPQPNVYEQLTAVAANAGVSYVQARRAQRSAMQLPADQREAISAMIVDRFPLHAETYPELARALTDLGRRDEAVGLLRKASMLHKPPVEMYRQLVAALAASGEAQEAMRLLTESKARFAEDPELQALGMKLGAPLTAG